MFERFGATAEKVATELSRRQMLGRCGRGALGLAGVLGGLLAFPAKSSAKDCPAGTHHVQCPDGSRICCPSRTVCAPAGWANPAYVCKTPGGGGNQ